MLVIQLGQALSEDKIRQDESHRSKLFRSLRAAVPISRCVVAETTAHEIENKADREVQNLQNNTCVGYRMQNNNEQPKVEMAAG